MTWLLPRLRSPRLLCMVGRRRRRLVVGGERGALDRRARSAGLLGVRGDRRSSTRCAAAPDALAARRPQDAPAPRDRRLLGRARLPHRARLRQRERAAELERERLAQFISAIEASPNGVLLLDAADQIEWCNARAAEHFGLDPERDRRQRVTNLVRSPAFVRLPAGRRVRRAGVVPRAARARHAAGDVRRYGGGIEARALAGHHRARAHRGDAARLRRQRLARDPHAADGARPASSRRCATCR